MSLLIITSLYADNIEVFPSYQGFRGVVNTPNSEVQNEGSFEFLYTNQTEDTDPSSKEDFRNQKEQMNFFLNMGFLPNLDLNFHYAYGFDYLKQVEYLSNRVVNAKYQLPFIPKDIFKMAVGIQDIGGGNTYISSKYAVASKDFNNFRLNVGYAIGEEKGSLDGIFGSMEYQPRSWLYLASEYDTKAWNAVVKSQYSINLASEKINLGIMAKSSLSYKDIYFGVYANMPFNNKSMVVKKDISKISSKLNLKSLNLSNTFYELKNNMVYYEYENTLYTYNDIDALGMVLGILSNTSKAEKIRVAIKKSNIIQYIVEINREEYNKFLKDGLYRSNLLRFKNQSLFTNLSENNSDRFRPTLTLEPHFVFIDGSEYSDVVDYTVALQSEISMRLAKGTILSGRCNIPLVKSENFQKNGIFSYRNRNKTDIEIDQLILSQFYKFDTSSPWINLLQVGRFDNELDGLSFESAISDTSGKHLLTLKLAKLQDNLYKKLDKYSEKEREEKLLAYRYYLEQLDSNLKITAGEFLYGDKGVSLSMQKYFSDTSIRIDLARTEYRSTKNDLLRLLVSIPFGTQKRVKTEYFDFQGGDLVYEKRKTLVGLGERSYVQPHHIKEIENSFGLEEYYLNSNRFHPAYIKRNHQRLRNVFLLF